MEEMIMRSDILWERFVVVILIVLVEASVLPSISGNLLETNKGIIQKPWADKEISIASTKTGVIDIIQQYQMKSLYITDDMPIWNIGDSWVYALSVSLEYVEPDVEISIDVSIGNLNFEVSSKGGGSYNLNVNGNIYGDFTFIIEGVPNIKGSLKDTHITGTSSVEQATLGLEELDLHIDGRLTLLGLVPIPLDIDLLVTFTPSYHTFSFPLIVGNEWNVNSSTLSIEGRIALPGITQLFPDIPEEIPITPPDFPLFGMTAYCSSEESVEVVAGQYTAYNVTVNDNTFVYYTPAVGNFISIVPTLSDFNEYALEFTFELVSTTYVDPEAPIIPNTPTGTKKGDINTEYTYSSSTTDPQGDQIYYLFNWDDGSNSGWLGPFNSGVTCEATHQWTQKGNYNIRVKAKDVNSAESHWSDPFPITMPYTYKPLQQFLELLFERFPHAFPLLRHLLGY
jgi:hypothetical protein